MGIGTTVNLHFEVLPSETQQALNVLREFQYIRNTQWYLAGGTALALQVGHRQSVDLDFFTTQADFDIAILERQLLYLGNWSTTFTEQGTLYGELHGAKVSFIANASFTPAIERVHHGAIAMLLPADIAVMKVMAISQRGKKRDFIDLYWYCTQSEYKETVATVVQRAIQQYSTQQDHMIHLLKSLVYFADAETDPMPQLMFAVDWLQVQQYFERKVTKIIRSIEVS